MSASAGRDAIDDMDAMRGQLYGLLGRLLARPPSADLLRRVAGIGGDGTALGQALTDLAAAAAATDAARVEREYHHLFIGVARGELLPFASFYLTGFLNEKPLARLRTDMARLGIARAEEVKDPEDHIASLCEMMAGLAAGDFQVSLAEQQLFFDRHLAPWADRFFQDLDRADSAVFYRAVAAVGRLFLAIETDAFRLAA